MYSSVKKKMILAPIHRLIMVHAYIHTNESRELGAICNRSIAITHRVMSPYALLNSCRETSSLKIVVKKNNHPDAINNGSNQIK